MNYHIPEDEITITFSRSSGPGGQNVNKTSTKASLAWNIGASRVFSEEQKFRIRHALANYISHADEVILSASRERSQGQNREQVVARLNSLVSQALVVKKKRRSTKPTYSSRRKRLESKKKQSTLKQTRRSGATGWL